MTCRLKPWEELNYAWTRQAAERLRLELTGQPRVAQLRCEPPAVGGSERSDRKKSRGDFIPACG